MTDHVTIARRYIELWNERTTSRRRELLSENWAADASYVDPLMKGDGQDGIDALIAGVQQRFPDFKFKLIGEPNGYGDQLRFGNQPANVFRMPLAHGADTHYSHAQLRQDFLRLEFVLRDG